VAGVALSASQAVLAQSLNQTPTVVHRPRCNNKNSFFPLTQAYFATALLRGDGQPFDQANRPLKCGNADLLCNIARNSVFCGESQTFTNIKAHSGILALQSRNRAGNDSRRILDVNCFALHRDNEQSNVPLVIQNVRFEKTPGFSEKCPVTYPKGRQFVQFGTGIRTWWTLPYSAPGTRFVLSVTSRALDTQGKIVFHTDEWEWRVCVTFDSLLALIDLLHSGSLGTSEIPCIFAEEVYGALYQQVQNLRAAVPGRGFTGDDSEQSMRVTAQNRLFNLEALIVAFCFMSDLCGFDETMFFGTGPGGAFQPPSNDIQTIMSMMAGIIDTPENPCCCKLLVDVEKLAEDYMITSDIPG
jgi:hypothetical protein